MISSHFFPKISIDHLPTFPNIYYHHYHLLPSLPFLISSSYIYQTVPIISKLMGLKKDFILVSAYFLILSTVLQAQDAFVNYYDFQFPPQKTNPNRGRMIIAFIIIALLNYLTLVVAPYLNCSIQKLATAACGILLIKYGCELATFMKIMIVIFEMGAFFADIVGTGLFYLSTLRLVQILCEKHEIKQRVGLCFGAAIGLYALSILIGYAIGYSFFEDTPVWLFLLVLTSLTIVAASIAYFNFVFQLNPQANAERQQANAERAQQNAQNQGQGNEEQFQLLRNGLHFGDIFKFTIKTYTKLLPLMGVQMTLGTLFAYGYQLLKYLVWTSQSDPVEQKLSNNRNIMVLYASGGIFTACLIGFICDKLPTRKFGYGLIVYNGLSLAFLYFALYIKYYYTTLLLFMFLGMTEFAMLVWLLAAISKLYKGIFEVIAANIQSIAMAASGYGLGVILFEGKMIPQTRLGIELTLLIGMNILAFLFMRKLPDNPVTIEYLVEQLDQSNVQQVNRDRQSTQVQRREEAVPVEIQMARKRNDLEAEIQKQQTIDPDNLL